MEFMNESQRPALFDCGERNAVDSSMINDELFLRYVLRVAAQLPR